MTVLCSIYCDFLTNCVVVVSEVKSSPNLSMMSSRPSQPSPNWSYKITSYKTSAVGQPPFPSSLSTLLVGDPDGTDPGGYVGSRELGARVPVGLGENEGTAEMDGAIEPVGNPEIRMVGVPVGPAEGRLVGCGYVGYDVGSGVIEGDAVGRVVVLVRSGSPSCNICGTLPGSDPSDLSDEGNIPESDTIVVHDRAPLTTDNVNAVVTRRNMLSPVFLDLVLCYVVEGTNRLHLAIIDDCFSSCW